MSTPLAKPIPAGFNSLSAHLIVNDGLAAIEFYKKALGAQEVMRMMSPDGKALMHAQLKVGNSTLMLASEFPPNCLSPKSRGGSSVFLHIYIENADALFDRAVAAGCQIRMPMSDTFWGGSLRSGGRSVRSSMVHRHASARLDAGTDRRQRQGILRQAAAGLILGVVAVAL